ncbi:MAG: hypothetical protein LBF88_03710, partial [Planctomycetaceae bacterium]|nr:hypothetical protein [Planctomycetaceae bacterium]
FSAVFIRSPIAKKLFIDSFALCQLQQIQTDVVKEVNKFTITPFFVKGGKKVFRNFFFNPVEPEILSLIF